jgi:molybdate transport system substrate-binding protein
MLCSLAGAQDITIAAASDLQFAMQDITARFQKETGKNVKATYGSSGNFAQQIQNGAPFDIFFSANLDYARQLESAGLAETGSFYQYATGKIVMWVPSESKLDLAPGLKILADPAVQKIAIANPQHAPYGKAAVAALQKAGIHDAVKNKFVLGENISQTASFAMSGAADVGIIALSLALSPNMKDKGRYVAISEDQYPPIEQACVILRASKNKAAAQQFLKYMQSPAIAEVLRAYGFAVPNAPSRQ